MADRHFWPNWDSDKSTLSEGSVGHDDAANGHHGDEPTSVLTPDDRAEPAHVGVFDDDPMVGEEMVDTQAPGEETSEGFAAELLDDDEYGAPQKPTFSRMVRNALGKIMMIAGATVAAVVVLYAVDLFLSWGKVPRGVTVAGVDVGSMNRTAAEQKLREQLEPRFTQPVKVTAGDVKTQFNPTQFGLGVDWQATLEQAGSQPLNPITRVMSFFVNREVGVVDKSDHALLKQSIQRLANTKINHGKTEGDIVFTDVPDKPGQVKASAVDPRQGQQLRDVNAAVKQVGTSWLSTTGVELPVDVDPATARRDGVHATLDKLVKPAISAPVTVDGGRIQTQLQPKDIANAFDFKPQQDGSLKPEVDKEALKGTLQPQFAATEQKPSDASIVFVNDKPKVKKGKPGKTVDWEQTLAPYLDVITKSKPEERTLKVTYTGDDPSVSTQDAKDLGISEVIGEGDIVGSSGGGAAGINGAIVKPGASFSLNEAGGGGDSGIATAVYNAAYFAGMSDLKSTTHRYYDDSFPPARDADGAGDVTFTNDSKTGVAIQVTGSSVKLWGTKHYDVESKTGARTDVVQPHDRVGSGSSCTPKTGSEGFTVKDTRVMTDVDSGQRHSDSRTVTYEAKPGVACRHTAPPSHSSSSTPADQIPAPPATSTKKKPGHH